MPHYSGRIPAVALEIEDQVVHASPKSTALVVGHLEDLVALEKLGDIMQTVRTLAKYALIVAVTMPLVSCAFFDQLSAMRTFKDANFLYGRGDYEAAIEEYQVVLDAVRADPEGELGQGMSIAYFYVANSYDSLFKPAFRGERENDEFLDNAEEYYQLAADNIPNAEFQKLSMQYLVAIYGPDKMNDPTRRSEMLQQMLTLEPENPDNYFVY